MGAAVGAALTHFGIEIPKHDWPEGHPAPSGQGVAVKQFCSASWYVSPQKRVLGVGDLDGEIVGTFVLFTGLPDGLSVALAIGLVIGSSSGQAV